MRLVASLRKISSKARKLAGMPLSYATLRLQAEIQKRLWQRPPGKREGQLDERALLRQLGQPTMQSLLCQIGRQHSAYRSSLVSQSLLNTYEPGLVTAIVEMADTVLDGWVCLLGSGPLRLEGIDWFRDYRSGLSWPPEYFAKINVADLDRPSDVKFPWELSRLQWLIPVGQAFHLTRNERYSYHVRCVIDTWIEANHCGWGVNWSCTMEAAMRVFTWTWFFHLLKDSQSWRDQGFRFRFLRTIFLHLQFIRGNLEISDVNGNHLVADAAALVVGGVFFGSGRPLRWMKTGWRLLQREILRQVLPDGVDFEGSTAYHRLVAELFLHAAATLAENGIAVPAQYCNSLLRMADYTRAYTKPDGLAPVIGDADDGRVLPLGQHRINDHRYLPTLIWARWAPERITHEWRLGVSECLWWLGEAPTATLPTSTPKPIAVFPDAGNVILRGDVDYVFVDCGPVGLSGRGGHGHNDCLSFEAVLAGHTLLVDPGSPTYTGDWRLRNRFRSTEVHNTPQIDDEEINRFVSPKSLWALHSDATARIELLQDGPSRSIFRGCHTGYERLQNPATIVRTLILDKVRHGLAWEDKLISKARHRVRLPLQFASGVCVVQLQNHWVQLVTGEESFILEWAASDDWKLAIEEGNISPSYGILLDALRLVWRNSAAGSAPVIFFLYPEYKPCALRRMDLQTSLVRWHDKNGHFLKSGLDSHEEVFNDRSLVISR